ncbi:MAG: glycine zipper 2TM domain-containing protein [Asticcacaulis sp.]
MKSLPKTTAALGAILLLSQPIAAMAQTSQPSGQGYVGPSAVPQHYAGPDDGYDRSVPPPPPPPGTRTGPDTYAADGYQPRNNPSEYDRYYARNDAPPPGDRRFDGYCYQRKDEAQANGAVIGAVAGGLIGNSVSNRWDRSGSTIAGAILGAILGSGVGRSSVECYGGRYYAYEDGYYAPPPPPEGYTVVYYERRPPVRFYNSVEFGFGFGGGSHYGGWQHRGW